MKDHLLMRIYGELTALQCMPMYRALGDHGTNNHAGWLAAYRKRGLAFGASRQEAEALRALAAEGMLKAHGSTQGKSHKLTVRGVRAAMYEDWTATGALLREIIAVQSKSAVRSPYGHHGGAALAMSWHLIPSAGEWLADALKSDKAWAAYVRKISRLQGVLVPLLILGYADLYHDGRGYWWGIMATDAGREAVKAWPDGPATPAADELFASWEEGYDAGLVKYAPPPPSDFNNVLACRLPAGGWASR